MKSQIEKIQSFPSKEQAGNLKFEEIVLGPSLKLWFVYVSMFMTTLCLKLFFMFEQQYFEWVWRTLVLGGVVYFGYTFIKHTTTTYKLNALEVIGQSGVFSKKVVRIPLNRIVNYESSASFLERLLGLNNIMLDTPGGTGFELIISRLRKQDSDLFVENLSYLMGQQKIAEAGTNTELRALRKQAVGY